jgi:hypothetical protein
MDSMAHPPHPVVGSGPRVLSPRWAARWRVTRPLAARH